MLIGRIPLPLYDLRLLRSLIMLARVVISGHLQTLDHEVGSHRSLVLGEAWKLALREVGILRSAPGLSTSRNSCRFSSISRCDMSRPLCVVCPGLADRPVSRQADRLVFPTNDCSMVRTSC